MTFLLCDPGWYVQLDVQNEWEENTHTLELILMLSYSSIISVSMAEERVAPLVTHSIRHRRYSSTSLSIRAHAHSAHGIASRKVFEPQNRQIRASCLALHTATILTLKHPFVQAKPSRISCAFDLYDLSGK